MTRKSIDMISKSRQEKLFQEGYRLAYHTRTKVKPWQQVYELWRKAAMNGHVKAQFYLGVCYDQGLGVRKDLRESFKWYMKAALNGMMEAQFNIGFFYKKGDLVRVISRRLQGKVTQKRSVIWAIVIFMGRA